MSNHVTLPRLSRSLDEVRSQVFGFVEGVQDTMAAKGFLPARLNLNRGVYAASLKFSAGANGRYTASSDAFSSRPPRTTPPGTGWIFTLTV